MSLATCKPPSQPGNAPATMPCHPPIMESAGDRYTRCAAHSGSDPVFARPPSTGALPQPLPHGACVVDNASPPSSAPATRPSSTPTHPVFLNITPSKETCLGIAAAAAPSTCAMLGAARWSKALVLSHDAKRLRPRPRRMTILGAMAVYPRGAHVIVFLVPTPAGAREPWRYACVLVGERLR